MAVRNYFSGCEGQQHFQAVMNAKADHVLVSYLYARKQNGNILKRRKRHNPRVKFMVDSGAHTFQKEVANPKSPYSKWTQQDFERYCEEFAAWVLKNKDYIECAVELDIDYPINFITKQPDPQNNPYGAQIVEGWQDKFFRPLEEKGIQIIYVWHEQRGMTGWEEMCSKFAYCGLPGEFSGRPEFNKYVQVARRYTTKLHGFAATAQRDFRDAQWFSIDSTTWKMGEIYGTIIHWDQNLQRLRYIGDKKQRVYFRRHFEKAGLDADAIIQEKPGCYKLMTTYTLLSMVGMEKFYVKRYAFRPFYYERRLPHPRLILAMGPGKIDALWLLMTCDEVLEKTHVKKFDDKKDILYWIALVQYRNSAVLALAPAMKFLEVYFEDLVKNQKPNLQAVQKAVAEMFMPPNPPALMRTDLEHYVPTNAPPKARDEEDIDLTDLIWTPEDEDIAREFDEN